MEQTETAESKLTYVNDAEYLLIDEVKTEPLDDNQPSDAFKINQRIRHLCSGCEKIMLLTNCFGVIKRFVIEIPTTPND